MLERAFGNNNGFGRNVSADSRSDSAATRVLRIQSVCRESCTEWLSDLSPPILRIQAILSIDASPYSPMALPAADSPPASLVPLCVRRLGRL